MLSHLVIKHLLLISLTYANTIPSPPRSIQDSNPLFDKTLNLATLNGNTGFNISGLFPEDGLGQVRTAGDINGDGIDDLILGAPYVNHYAGAAYVIFGKATGFNASFDLNTLNGKNGFTIPGINNIPNLSSSQLGTSVSTAGDINGDGITDLILGAPYVNFDAGAAYVIFGQVSGFNASFDLYALNGKNGFDISGSVNLLGISVNTAGDINGDGIMDLVLGADFDAGAAHVIFGQASGFNASFDLNTLNGKNGFTILGLASGNCLGRSVCTAGDINGDGINDLILGTGGNLDTAYVIFGQASGFDPSFDLNTLNGKNGFTIPGLSSSILKRVNVCTAGDINGDGITDLVLGEVHGGNNEKGIAYVIFGQASGFNASFDLNTLNGKNGFTIPGLWGNNLGRSVSTGGDINGDGITDLVLGAPDSIGDGAVYVIFGQDSGFNTYFDLNTLNGKNGFTIPALYYSGLGASVSNAGDINGDGIADLILGDPINEGTAYAIFGKFPLCAGNNMLVIKQARSVKITSDYLSAVDLNGFSQTLQSNITGLQGGQFVWLANHSQPISVFEQQAIMDGQIQFIQNGSPLGVSYHVSVTNRAVTLSLPPANITFILTAPFVNHLIPNQTMVIYQLFNWTLPADNILSRDFQPMTYVLRQANGSALPSWLQFNTKTLQLCGTPTMKLTLPLTLLATDPYQLSADNNFTLSAHQYAPLLINNTITIKQARSTRITSNNLSGLDLNGSPRTMQFMITNLRGGQFKRYNDSQPVIQFEQQAITDGNIQFVQDGSSTGVAYQVIVSNEVTVTPPLNANVTFILTEPLVYRPFPNQTVEMNQMFNWTLSDDTFLSPENLPLTLSLLASNGAALPDWIQFDPNNHQLTGRAISAGITHFSLFAHDPYNLSARTDFTLSVPNKGLGILFWLAVGFGGFILVGLLLGVWFYYYRKSDYKEIPDVPRENIDISSSNPQQQSTQLIQ